MYYKVEQKDSPLYSALHALRVEELRIEAENKVTIRQRVGSDWTSFLGKGGQQNLNRTSSYRGFKFTEPDKIDPKAWKPLDKAPDHFVPNRRTRAGRDMDEFLLNGLPQSWFGKVFDIFNVDYHSGRFTFPFVEIVDGVILIYVDFETQHEGAIEITKREFDNILSKLHNTPAAPAS